MERVVLKAFRDRDEYWEWSKDMEDIDEFVRRAMAEYPRLVRIDFDVDNLIITGYLKTEE